MGLSLFKRRPRARLGGASERQIEIDGETVAITIAGHPRARRITLRLLPGGGLKLTLPPHVGDAEIDAFLIRHKAWIAARRARLPEPVRLVAGASIPYRGIAHRIVHLDRRRGIVESREIAGEMSLLVPGEPQYLQRRLLAFLKRQARAEIDRAVARHATTLGVRAKRLRITDTTSRWGSCSSTRTLSFSWRIILAPPEVLDYLAAHEVAHLVEMNHSERFWALVRRLCPEMDRHKAWLARHGATLHALALD